MQRVNPLKELMEFTDCYVLAALWYSEDENGRPLDAEYTAADISQETLERMQEDCREFFTENRNFILCDGAPTGFTGTGPVGMAGYDFWLTRCGHGAGFWDGDWPEPYAGLLTAAACAYGEVNLHVGVDGLICD